jgi:hypothetical protein
MPTPSRVPVPTLRPIVVGLATAVGCAVVAPLTAQQGNAPSRPATASVRSSNLPAGVFHSGDKVTAIIAADGTMRMVMPSGSWLAHYRTHGDTVFVADDSPACTNAGEGSYRWTFDGTELDLVPLADPCEARLASGLLTWRRDTLPAINPDPATKPAKGAAQARRTTRLGTEYGDRLACAMQGAVVLYPVRRSALIAGPGTFGYPVTIPVTESNVGSEGFKAANARERNPNDWERGCLANC